MVNSSPWGSSRSALALRLFRAALDAGETVTAVYFRGDGVYHGMVGQRVDKGAENLFDEFTALADTAQVPLLLCSAAVSRRLPTEQAQPAAPWSLAGLARWVELLDESDRVVRL